MASKIKGTSTQQLINMDPRALVKMSEKELRQVVSRMADAANKRVARLEKAGLPSQAVTGHRGTGGKFSTKGLNLNQLRGEYARIRNFMQSQTSTVKGAQDVQSQVMEGLSDKGISITPEQYKDFWRAYEKLKEQDPSIKANNLKYRVLQEIAAEMDGEPKSMDEIVAGIGSRLDEIYEQTQELSDGGVSQYFTLD